MLLPFVPIQGYTVLGVGELIFAFRVELEMLRADRFVGEIGEENRSACSAGVKVFEHSAGQRKKAITDMIELIANRQRPWVLQAEVSPVAPSADIADKGCGEVPLEG